MIPLDERSLLIFLLVLARLSGLMLVVPFLGHRNVPVMVKAAVVLVLTVVTAPLAALPAEVKGLDIDFALRVAFEVLVGLLIGYIFLAVFMAVTMAGQFIDFELGFGLAQVFDPSFGYGASILSRFYYLLALVVFLLSDGHHLIVLALAGSYRIFPMGSLSFPVAAPSAVLGVLSDVFLVALKVGAPVIGALFVADVVFGIVARAVPQMNVFVIGFPLKILLGLAAVAITLPFTVGFMGGLVSGLGSLLARAF
jgi:flagellar biosynthetic protein FliR